MCSSHFHYQIRPTTAQPEIREGAALHGPAAGLPFFYKSKANQGKAEQSKTQKPHGVSGTAVDPRRRERAGPAACHRPPRGPPCPRSGGRCRRGGTGRDGGRERERGGRSTTPCPAPRWQRRGRRTARPTRPLLTLSSGSGDCDRQGGQRQAGRAEAGRQAGSRQTRRTSGSPAAPRPFHPTLTFTAAVAAMLAAGGPFRPGVRARPGGRRVSCDGRSLGNS